jgi:hypothetical protein
LNVFSSEPNLALKKKSSTIWRVYDPICKNRFTHQLNHCQLDHWCTFQLVHSYTHQVTHLSHHTMVNSIECAAKHLCTAPANATLWMIWEGVKVTNLT